MKYNDLDGNGINDGEPGMEGWTIKLTGNGLDNQTVEKEIATGSDGSFKFEGLSPGSYTVSEVEQSGWKRTAPAEALMPSASPMPMYRARTSEPRLMVHIGKRIPDSNGNGAKDTDETGQQAGAFSSPEKAQ